MNGVEVNTQGENLAVGKTRQLFGGRLFGNTIGMFPANDSKRWLGAFAVEEANASPIILTTNWSATLKP